MNIEDRFSRSVQLVVNEISTELLVGDSNSIRFRFVDGTDAPTEREQQRVCRWLVDLGAVKIVENVNQKLPFSIGYPFTGALIGYVFEIDTAIFYELAKIYSVEINNHTDHKNLLEKAKKLKKVEKVIPSKVREEVSAPRVLFSEETREIILDGKVCEVPVGNQFEVVKAIFKVPLGTWVNETNVVGNFSKGDNKQSFYDAQRYLNDRIQSKLGVKKLIEYKGSSVRLDPVVMEKLGHP
ncbi:hypothetical protein COT87_01810 [Candidatus Collierbacteria bacterium CG10_big_fil_rev_8_21_14_0_10_44_9]|uniref:Uncharacterized protein n=1 Tax=Candidatus Collierbacteria bacterium CG10_big_fil_rev_8_21_14_0_10_44_9 TaxID=1974535 RepID=A0A2H0VIR6_9BACT|nr:MAG: hypothetical protein COT87_01810 [Candidatus Collierbacteria bacterium CG10_big_fil_rev_8_21_14_0_10_44_9]